jgi:hypothetical protein
LSREDATTARRPNSQRTRPDKTGRQVQEIVGARAYLTRDGKQQVEQQLQNYKEFRALTQEWIDKAVKLAKMRVDMQKA